MNEKSECPVCGRTVRALGVHLFTHMGGDDRRAAWDEAWRNFQKARAPKGRGLEMAALYPNGPEPRVRKSA
jgi:hypothetical protein